MRQPRGDLAKAFDAWGRQRQDDIWRLHSTLLYLIILWSTAVWFTALCHKNRSSCVEATVCQAHRRGTAQHWCSDGQSSELADNTSHSPRKQIEKVEISFWCLIDICFQFVTTQFLGLKDDFEGVYKKVTKENKYMTRRRNFALPRQIFLMKFSGSQKLRENIEKYLFK